MCVQGLSFGWGHYCSLVSTYTSFGKYGLALATYRQAQAQGGKTTTSRKLQARPSLPLIGSGLTLCAGVLVLVSDEGEVLVKAALEAAAKGGLADDALE